MVIVYSHRFFPEYVGGGERLAHLTALGLQRNGLKAVILTVSGADETTESEFQGVKVIRAPDRWLMGGENGNSLSNQFRDLIFQFNPIAVHIVGVTGAGSVIRTLAGGTLPTGLATTDYSLICNTATLVRQGGSLCSGRVSDADCFQCRLEGSRQRDRILAASGRYMPAAARAAIKSTLTAIAGAPRGAQIEWWSHLRSSEAVRQDIWRSANVVVHGTRFSAEAHTRAAPAEHKGKNRYFHHPVGPAVPLRKLRMSDDPIVAGFIGRAIPMKGLHTLLDAIAQNQAAGIRLIVSAPTNSDWLAYEQEVRIRASAMPDRIEWRSGTAFSNSDLDEIHGSIDVLVVPSLWPEYVGLVTLEALARGTPVVLTDFEPQRELFGHLPQVRLVKPGDADGIIAAIRELAAKFKAGAPIYSAVPSVSEYAKLLLNAYKLTN